MNPHLAAATLAPLAYVVGAIALFLSLSFVAKVRTAGRARLFAIIALASALAGAVCEAGTASAGGFLVVVVVGAIAGGLLAMRVSPSTPATRVSFIAAFAGGAAAALALALLGEGGLTAPQTASAGIAIVLGGYSVLLGVALTARGGTGVRSSAWSAIAGACAGWSAAMLGFAMSNLLLLLAGGVLGTAAFAVARLMARATKRPLDGVLFSGAGATDEFGYHNVRACGTEEAAMVLESASRVVVVPGFGMAAAGAQHPAKEMVELLEKKGAKVIYAVAPGAGCVPGHMNIALDEANVPHAPIKPAAESHDAIAQADAVLVVGANDVVNAMAARDPGNPLFGLDALDLSQARSVFVVKRSLRPGAAGVKNPLFERANTMMIFGDAKRVLQSLVAELKSSAH